MVEGRHPCLTDWRLGPNPITLRKATSLFSCLSAYLKWLHRDERDSIVSFRIKCDLELLLHVNGYYQENDRVDTEHPIMPWVVCLNHLGIF